MERAIVLAEREGLLGAEAKFDLEVRVGAGAYVCGEETSLLESLEGKRGQVRAKPPLPAHKGLFGKPTVINNLISLATVPAILADGAEHYAALGMGRSRGTMPIQLAGNAKHGGLFEAAFGLTLGEIVEDIGGGTQERPAGARRPGRRAARRLFPTQAVRHAVRLRGLRRPRRPDRPWRRRGVRRHGRHGPPGALRAGILRHRILRQVHALPHRLGARHRDHGQDHPRRARRGQPRAGHRPLPDAEVRLAVCAGRLHALSGDERHPAFPRGFQPPAPARLRRNKEQAMSLVHETDYGTPSQQIVRDGDPHHRRPGRHGARRHLDHARGDGYRHPGAQALRHRLGRRLRLLPSLPGRDPGPPRHARFVHHAGRQRHGGVDPDRAAEADPQGRDGALHLRPSARLPDLRRQRRLRIAGHGGRRRPARRALRLRRREPHQAGQGRVQPVLHLRSVEVHRLLALRARLRGSAGHVRAHHPGPRLRFQGLGRHGRAVRRFGVRVVRRLRAGLPDGDAVGEERHRHRRARAFGGDDLRLLRRRLQLQGRDARRGTRAHGPLQGRQGQSRAFVREGPLRLGLRQPSRAHPEADDPRDHRPAVARSDLGSGDRARRLGVQAPAGQARPAGDRRHHLVTLHQRGDLPGAEAGARRLRQQQRRYLRPRLPFADRLWPQDRVRHLGRHAGLRLGRAYRRRPDHRRQPDRRPSGVRLAHEEAAAPGRQADRHRSAPHRHGAHAAHRGRSTICRCARAPTPRC